MTHELMEPRLFLNGEFMDRYTVTLNGQTEVEIPTNFRRITSWFFSKNPDSGEVPFYEVYGRTSGSTFYVWCSDTRVTTDEVTLFVLGTT